MNNAFYHSKNAGRQPFGGVRYGILLRFLLYGAVIDRVDSMSVQRGAHTWLRASAQSSKPLQSPRKIAVIGGGLAGLATVFHIIDKQPGVHVTVFDKVPVGTGGASSVAGGYVMLYVR